MVQGQAAEFINTPTFRSGKVDVASFSGNFTFEADMKPFWKDFIRTFRGARFTVKNYGASKYESIHLGNTDITKSLLGSLSDIVNKEIGTINFLFITGHQTTTRKLICETQV